MIAENQRYSKLSETTNPFSKLLHTDNMVVFEQWHISFNRRRCFIFYFTDERSDFTTMFNELDLPFSQDGLTKAIKQLGLNKSSGPDLYLNELFMYGKYV